MCCPHRRTYFSPSFHGNVFGGGNPQFGGSSFPVLQPAGFPWWRVEGVESGFPTHPSIPSIPVDPPAPETPVDVGPPPTASMEAFTEKPTTTESWETWTPPTTTSSTTTTPSLESEITTTTTTQQKVITYPPPTDIGNEGVSKPTCGRGAYRAPSWDEGIRPMLGYTAPPNSWPFMVIAIQLPYQFQLNSKYVETGFHAK